MDVSLLILFTALLVILAAVCSGLNIAIMALDVSDIRRKAHLGNSYAKQVLPLRENPHLTLASILLVNVAAVSASSILLDSKLNGFVAAGITTFLMVVFGEITPQALFSRNALKYCGIFSPLLRLMIVLTFPLSKPLQLVLDKLFGHSAAQLQSRHELGMIISEHLGHNSSELDEDEVEIMRGALGLSEKRVREIMTHISHVYWLTPDTLIDAAMIDEIKQRGWSRIPIFNKQLTTCHGVLLMKELVDIDFDEEPMQVKELPLHAAKLVGNMTALDTMFRTFIGAQTHLLPIEKDDRIVGIVTIEDLVEEIIGHEIRDEIDHQQARA